MRAIAYGAVVVSVIVLVGFAAMLWLVIREEVPSNQRDMVNLLLGTLAGMASSVVACWVGSSSGSMQKNSALEKALAQKSDRMLRGDHCYRTTIEPSSLPYSSIFGCGRTSIKPCRA